MHLDSIFTYIYKLILNFSESFDIKLNDIISGTKKKIDIDFKKVYKNSENYIKIKNIQKIHRKNKTQTLKIFN